MTARIIDGEAIAAEIRVSLKREVEKLLLSGKSRPGLAAVLVGDDPASHTYVRLKRKASAEVGIESVAQELAADSSQEQIENLVHELNADPTIHGILVQLPLPQGIDEEAVLGAISIEKDVDGFHPLNIGKLAMKGREPLFVPATPAGCITLLKSAGATLQGANAVVVGRSNIVGMPAALLLVRENATVTICHSRTKDLQSVCRNADILIAAIGRAEMIRGDWIKPGAFVIDVGTNRVDDASKERGYRLVGDVAFDEAIEVAQAITPVPGGVGPMTIAGLLRNTLQSAQRLQGYMGEAML
ncbi:MAG: bifunctional methylenetetrahydrofolate dehydrogenase/methenyltetrahydrofolate cyclohydrolase FolD [Chloroflexi bacterium]|nr:bifunctional methylenetetrahydrofolate dehydrogenase/methenyltetrahydrofolate cyclohydrolase FolD [Chloroflexota bacterium]